MRYLSPSLGNWQIRRVDNAQNQPTLVSGPSALQTIQPTLQPSQYQQPMAQDWQSRMPAAAQPAQQPVGQNYLSQLLNFAPQPLGRQNYFQALY